MGAEPQPGAARFEFGPISQSMISSNDGDESVVVRETACDATRQCSSALHSGPQDRRMSADFTQWTMDIF
jgi:hypothetical protein